MKRNDWKIGVVLSVLALLLMYGCGVPDVENAPVIEKSPQIFPDYSSIEIPLNIAPLNFLIEEEGEQFYTILKGADGSEINVKGKELNIPIKEWKEMLSRNAGKSYSVRVFVKSKGVWKQYAEFENQISAKKIDPYVNYRLIEPLFETWNEMGLYQRCLENFDEETIFHNRLTDGGCMNCHAFQANSSKNMMFHLRAKYSGTMIITGDQIKKVNLKTDETMSAGVYPAWHPSKKLIAYSVNKIGQMFHVSNQQKVSVDDMASDLILYNIETDQVSHIIKSEDGMETFPSWSPDGDYLYYCSAPARIGESSGLPDMKKDLQSIKYNIMRIAFDQNTLSFGAMDTVVDANQINKSASFPRVSPDGRFLMFTRANEGNFTIWNKSADLYLKDLKEGSIKALKKVNSKDVESYHSWSSSSEWFVFSSRRMDGYYTRLYIAGINDKGECTKPFLIPFEKPSNITRLLKSFNIPEFTSSPFHISTRKLERYVRKSPTNVEYIVK